MTWLTIQIPDHLTTGQKSTIWIPDKSGIQMVTLDDYFLSFWMPDKYGVRILTIMKCFIMGQTILLLNKTRQLTCRFFMTEKIPFGNEESLFFASKSSSRDVKLSKHPVSRDTIRLPFRFSFLKIKKIYQGSILCKWFASKLIAKLEFFCLFRQLRKVENMGFCQCFYPLLEKSTYPHTVYTDGSRAVVV